jgi:long-chain acyl-CoA synthetase
VTDSVRSVPQLVAAAAAARPGRTALVDEQRRLSWAELDGQVSRAARGLLAEGLAPGDRVGLRLPTGIDLAVLYLGALRAGLIAVPIDPACTAPEARHILADSGAALCVDGQNVGRIAAGPAAARPLPVAGNAEDIAVLLYTSGTTGTPRGAMLSNRALLANLDQLAAVEPALLTADDVLFVPLPLTHVFGLNAGLGMALRVGATTVLAGRFDPAATLGQMGAEGVTAVAAVPGQYAAWLRRPELRDGFARVRMAMSGSATLSRAVVAGYAELGVRLYDGYGLTEAAPVVALNVLGARRARMAPTVSPGARAGDEGAGAIGTVGHPLPGVEVQLRDADSTGGAVLEADSGDPGRIFVRGPNLFSGYWPDGADGPDAGGWFGTGDIAVQDADGELHLVGRSAELVIVNGFNVYPAEVEAVLAADPAVAEVAVTGVPDERTGEAVRAYVGPARGATVRADELLAAAGRSLARFKLPAVIEVVTELPHTVTGKVMKWVLGDNQYDGEGRTGGGD